MRRFPIDSLLLSVIIDRLCKVNDSAKSHAEITG